MREGEEAELLAFIHSLFPNASPSFGPADHFLVASAGGRLIGFVHLCEKSAHVYLQGVGVDASWRSRGVGHRLLNSAIRLVAARQPGRAVRLKVKPTNQPAVRLYLREGFQLSRVLGRSYLLSKAPNN